jgi:hypothetical protein
LGFLGYRFLINSYSGEPKLIEVKGFSDSRGKILPIKQGTDLDIRELLNGGIPLVDIVVPKTGPGNVQQLTLFGAA